MISENDKGLITRYLDGDLTQEEEERVLSLLASDPEARQYAHEMRAMKRAVLDASEGSSVPEDVDLRIQKALNHYRSSFTTDRVSVSRQPTRQAWRFAVRVMSASLLFGGVIIYRTAVHPADTRKPLKLAVVVTSNLVWPVVLKEVDYFETVKFYVTGHDTAVGGTVREGVYEDYEIDNLRSAVYTPPSWYRTASPRHICNVLLRPHRVGGDPILVDIHHVFSDIDFRSSTDIVSQKWYRVEQLTLTILEPKCLTSLAGKFKPSSFRVLVWTRSPQAEALENKALESSFVPLDKQTEPLAEVARLSGGVTKLNISGVLHKFDPKTGRITESKDFQISTVDTLYESSLLPVATPLRQKVYKLSATSTPYAEGVNIYIDGLYVVPVERVSGKLKIRIYEIWRSEEMDAFKRTVEKIDDRQVSSGETFEVQLLAAREEPLVREHPLPLRATLTISF